MGKKRQASKVEATRYAGRMGDAEYGVSTIVSKRGDNQCYHMPRPCAQCPWVKGREGVFPAEAYRISAPTSYDAGMTTFACHMAGSENPATCAGFLLRNADNNLQVRISAAMRGEDFSDLTDGGEQLYRNYREMAIANGVDPDDPVIAPCRNNDGSYDVKQSWER